MKIGINSFLWAGGRESGLARGMRNATADFYKAGKFHAFCVRITQAGRIPPWTRAWSAALSLRQLDCYEQRAAYWIVVCALINPFRTMTPSKSRFQCGALTLLEVLVLCAVLAVLIALLMPPRHHESVRRSVCLNNLKNIGLAFRIFESDHSGRFPMQLSTNAGGSLEFVAGGNAFRHFQVMSNELFTPNVLVCPSEKRRAVTNFAVLNNAYLSYFVGLDAVTNLWEMLLAGDRNITNSEPS